MNLLEKINETLKGIQVSLSSEKTEPTKLAEMSLKDGNKVFTSAESFEAGADIALVTDEGNLPLAVGEYEAEDGTMLVVAEEGILAEVKPAAEEEAAPEEEGQEMEQTEAILKAISEGIAPIVAELKADYESKLQAQNEALLKSVTDIKEAVEVKFSKLEETPATEEKPAHAPKVPAQKVDLKKMTKKERIAHTFIK